MWIAVLAACSRGPSVAGTPEVDVAPCEPWDRLGVELGSIAYCDPDRLVLHFPAGSAEALGPTLRLAVREAGWEEDVDSSAPGMVNVRYLQADDHLALSIVDDGPRTVAILTVVHGAAR